MKALLIVDLQKDFCEGGALPVTGGNAIVPYINGLMVSMLAARGMILASKDWHPEHTIHFKRDGGKLWPVHCVADSRGAEFHDQLDTKLINFVLVKGTKNLDNGYSAFEATNENLVELLHAHKVDELIVCGLATDYCVKATVLDALHAGFKVKVATKAIAAVNVNSGDGEAALKEMVEAGAELL